MPKYLELFKEFEKIRNPFDTSLLKPHEGLVVKEIKILPVPCEDHKWVVRLLFDDWFRKNCLNIFSFDYPQLTEEQLQIFVDSTLLKVRVKQMPVRHNYFNPRNWFLPNFRSELVLEFDCGKYLALPSPAYIPEKTCEANFAESL